MKVTMSQVLELEALSSKIDELSRNLPIGIVYKFTKLFKAAHEEFNFYESHLGDIIDKYAERNDKNEIVYLDDTSIKIKEDCLEEAKKSLQDLTVVQVELPDIIFNINELEGLKLSVAELNILLPFIQE